MLTPDERARLGSDGLWIKLARELTAAFTEAMDDDFNTPRALAALFSFVSEAYRQGVETAGEDLDFTAALETWQELTAVLGLRVRPVDLTGSRATGENALGERLVAALVSRREQARKSRDFVTADMLRDILNENGIQLEDAPSGTRWKITNPSKGKRND